ncbi:MAG: hypothetical protein H7Y31_11520 [Chitinophagaceae bacterium]|nr:hypothetical protein [Chitinophagaceae bacterium]
MLKTIRIVRLPIIESLTFCFIMLSCKSGDEKKNSLVLVWEQDKAVAVGFNKQLLSANDQPDIAKKLHVEIVGDSNQESILGSIDLSGDSIFFRPYIPFTKGDSYRVKFNNVVIAIVRIPEPTGPAPEIVNIYPTNDTVPVNLLKLYIAFSIPMREGKWRDNIVLIKNGVDTVSDAFLDVDLELWNNEHTVLTIWFDPGRVKRGLQPNEKLGSPLHEKQKYELLVLKNLEDVDGRILRTGGSKRFFVNDRDSESPHVDDWLIRIPKSDTRTALHFSFGESLDAMLLENSISINYNEHGLAGVFEPINKERELRFIPEASWQVGEYEIIVDPILEDLAGNNMTRLFDNPIDSSKKIKPSLRRKFTIK